MPRFTVDTSTRCAVDAGGDREAAKAAVKVLTPAQLRRRALRFTQRRVVHGAPPANDEQLTRELRERFKPEVVALGDYLQRDLVTLWGYDDVG